ncbi:MAG: DUF3015 family protein [Planctomycetota bacterium]
MTKLLLPVVALMAAASMQAANVRDNVGIGLGTVIFEGNDGLLSQVCAATTNGCFGNQTFAITTGTLGARPYSGIVSNEKVQGFVRDNLDQLAREMAAGQGESLEALAEIMAVPKADRQTFAKNLQKNFAQIYSSPTVTNTEVVTNLAKVIEKA